MNDYRLYFLGPDGHICKAQDIRCKNDLEAFRIAKGLLNGRAIEIWQEARQVAHVSPVPVEENISLRRPARAASN